MAYQDEIDYAEHAAVHAQVADERRCERGRRITVTVEWERPLHGLWPDDDFAEQLRATLVSVAELGADSQENSIVFSQIEQLGDDD